MASQNGKVQLFQKLWELAKIVLTQEELNNKIFLTKDNFRRTAWHMAAENDHIQALHKLWEWAKEVLTPKELYNM